MARTDLAFGLSVVLLLSWVVGCPGSGSGDDSPKESDVPCFTPEAWVNLGTLLVRSERADGTGSIFLTQQTTSQIRADNEDGQLNFSPHDAVYAFDPETQEISLAASENWDAALGQVASRNGSSGDSLFSIGSRMGRPPLLFNGNVVPVQGGTAVTIYEAQGEQFVAVVSATGVSLIPLFSNGQTSGQHFHQLFSQVTGGPIGPALRIGIGGHDVGPVNGRWVANDRYVVHETNTSGSYDLICIVDVQDVLNDSSKQSR